MTDLYFWEREANENVKSLRETESSSEWTSQTPTILSTAPSRSSSPVGMGGESICNKYMDIIHSESNLNEDQSETLDRPFDFFDDEEFAFGINILNNNVVCVGDNVTKQIQMAQEPWPDNVKLFQPYEVEQILLPDNASCLAVQAFLKMCNLPFEVEMRWNAEFMSPSGRVPFIKCGAFVVSELEPIVQFAANKGVSLCGELSMEEKAEMRAYMSLITNVLVNAELYISWMDDETFNAVTKVRNSSVYPWPLGWLQTRSKRNSVAKRLRALHWGDKTLEQVLADVDQCCNSLSQRLGDKDYFFGSSPTPLDALVFGHMRALLSAKGPKAALMIKPMTSSLLKHVVRMVSATGMLLTDQEEYLISQALQVTKYLSNFERNARIRRSRMCVRSLSKENLPHNRELRETNGFKPFASKQIIISTTKDGGVVCALKTDELTKICSTTTFELNTSYSFITQIFEDVVEKAIEVALDNTVAEKHDFEMVYPHEERFHSGPPVKLPEFLDTIEENDVTDTTTSAELVDDLVHVINDCSDDVDNSDVNDHTVVDSDGIVNDKLLDVADMVQEKYIFVGSDATDSSNNKNMKGSNVTVTSCGDRTKSDKSDLLVSSSVNAMAVINPTELDALVFGHVFTIITTRLPRRRLADTVRRHESLVALAKRVDEQYFKRA